MLTLDVEATDTIDFVLARAQDQVGKCEFPLCLTLGGKTLRGDRTLFEYNIQKKAELEIDIDVDKVHIDRTGKVHVRKR